MGPPIERAAARQSLQEHFATPNDSDVRRPRSTSRLGPAANANHVLRGAGVKAEARRGRVPRGAWTLASTGLDLNVTGPRSGAFTISIAWGSLSS